MKYDVYHRLQSVIGQLLLFNEKPDGVFLLQQCVQINGAASLSELILDIRQAIVRRIAVQQTQFSGNQQQYFAQAVNFSDDVIFPIFLLLVFHFQALDDSVA